jgi:5-methylcytosine-specific restriction endonuclease McrA
MGNAFYGREYQCKSCGLWLGKRWRSEHQLQHRIKTENIKRKNGITSKPTSDKGRLKVKAKRELSLINHCAYCGKPGDLTNNRGPDGLYWHMDHVMPYAKYAIEDLENYVKACHTCNLKRNKTNQMPRPDAMTAAHLTWRGTGLYNRMKSKGAIK